MAILTANTRICRCAATYGEHAPRGKVGAGAVNDTRVQRAENGTSMEQRNDAADEKGTGKRPYVTIAGRRLPIPRSRLARLASGFALVVFGLFGFLPVLGFWMIPVGLIILSYDVAVVRRLRRRFEVWWHRRKQARKQARE